MPLWCPQPGPAQVRHHASNLRERPTPLEQAVSLFSVLLQLALFARSGGRISLQQLGYQAALLVLRSVCLAAATFLPERPWRRWRVLLIGVLRCAIASVPTQRSAAASAGLRVVQLPALPACLVARWGRVAHPARPQPPPRLPPASQEGDAVLLQRAATPGARGLITDWLRFVTGEPPRQRDAGALELLAVLRRILQHPSPAALCPAAALQAPACCRWA